MKYIHQTGAARPGCKMLQWGSTLFLIVVCMLECGFNDSRRLAHSEDLHGDLFDFFLANEACGFGGVCVCAFSSCKCSWRLIYSPCIAGDRVARERAAGVRDAGARPSAAFSDAAPGLAISRSALHATATVTVTTDSLSILLML